MQPCDPPADTLEPIVASRACAAGTEVKCELSSGEFFAGTVVSGVKKTPWLKVRFPGGRDGGSHDLVLHPTRIPMWITYRPPRIGANYQVSPENIPECVKGCAPLPQSRRGMHTKSKPLSLAFKRCTRAGASATRRLQTSTL